MRSVRAEPWGGCPKSLLGRRAESICEDGASKGSARVDFETFASRFLRILLPSSHHPWTAKGQGRSNSAPCRGSSPARAGNSAGRLDARSQLPRHLVRADRRAHLGEEPVRLAQLALPARVVAENACERRPLERDERQVTSRASLLDQAQRDGQGLL